MTQNMENSNKKRIIQEVTHDEAPLYDENEKKTEYKKMNNDVWVLQDDKIHKIPSRYWLKIFFC